jgi:hypothetical protein
MVETKIGENRKIQERQMGWREDLGKKMESKKLKHEKNTSKEWCAKSSIICILLLYVLFYHTLQKNQRFQQKGDKKCTSTFTSIPNLS